MIRISHAESHATLHRFVAAQDGTYLDALSELKRGSKQSHWMWFIFPQLRGLGQSTMSLFYGIENLDEARRYLMHPVLGPRLVACTNAALSHGEISAEAIFGTVDAGKFRSSATLFATAARDEPDVFKNVITTFFNGQHCRITADRLHSAPD
ncbi:DUF1810 domain-containing protein [Paracoccus nototheniae]|uniref:DUF1810 domain-containing protein n=1 Tax=Paracoccus nototheniae TaxID=2489002 RepID=A0ABW4DTH6_9RHOB|nr:DUF1810 domain-containing protein [Paracoccus nototheniae]